MKGEKIDNNDDDFLPLTVTVTYGVIGEENCFHEEIVMRLLC